MPEIAFPNLIPALPESFLAVAAMLLLMIGVFSREELAARTVGYGSVIVLIVAMVFVGLVTEVVFSPSAAHSSRTLLLFSSK